MNGVVRRRRSAVPSTTNWLPSLNLRFGLTDDQFLRFAVSRALARPDMGLYKYYYQRGARRSGLAPPARSRTIRRAIAPATRWRTTPRYTADAGNPALEPTTADQLDLTYEWYFSNTGSFTAALFYQEVQRLHPVRQLHRASSPTTA